MEERASALYLTSVHGLLLIGASTPLSKYHFDAFVYNYPELTIKPHWRLVRQSMVIQRTSVERRFNYYYHER
jgi:hypothetical protein